MNLIELLVIAAAVARATHIVNYESGPFDLFVHLRILAGVDYDEAGNVRINNWLAAGIVCPACVSFWLGLGMALLLSLPWYYGLAFSLAAMSWSRWHDG